MSKKLVLMDHDGAIDDFLALVLLMAMEKIHPLGIVVTPADCYIQAALNVTRKILDLLGRSDLPVAQSIVRGVNPFPPNYRQDCLIIDNFPILNERETIHAPLVEEAGQQFMVRVLQEATEPVTLMVTGPLTTVATALTLAPEIESKIQEIVWSGRALMFLAMSRKFLPQNMTGRLNGMLFGILLLSNKSGKPIFLCFCVRWILLIPFP